jgi:hypothetical protein
MARLDLHLQRLLKLAAAAKDEEVSEMPFGFDTRVLANWRAAQNSGNGEVARFVRRVALVAMAIMVLSGAAAYRQLSEDEDLSESLTNDYVIADSMIERQMLQ